MGICLGHQLLALAVGARTIKLKYGNRAHNIPALDLTTGLCHITSQNHGYAIDASTLPSDFKEYFVNLNDGSNEGMLHKTRPIFSTQFHPEAKGGPMDSSYLFDKYLQNVQLAKSNQVVFKDNRPTPLMLDIMSRERQVLHPAWSVSFSDVNTHTQNMTRIKAVFRIKTMIKIKVTQFTDVSTPIVYFLAFYCLNAALHVI
ncbi:hypothetical protein HZ326_2259 [Fusarium oxysporum f. sp. albedinis]|nr:hypothetical protein HZ326_2259 [Fusarium oxysporum f. sp. albedinis]